MKHTLSVLVENKPGVLTRIAGLFARRGFNIESLAVGQSENPHMSRMTITIDGAEHPIDQVTKQLHKLINVVKIRDLDPNPWWRASWCWCASRPRTHKRAEVMQLAELFKAQVVDVDRKSLVLEITTTPEQLASFTNLLQPLGIVELVRTGTVAIGRGAASAAPRTAPARDLLTFAEWHIRRAAVAASVTEFAARFRERSGSLRCPDILGCDVRTPEGMKTALEKDLFATTCSKAVRDACEILEHMV